MVHVQARRSFRARRGRQQVSGEVTVLQAFVYGDSSSYFVGACDNHISATSPSSVLRLQLLERCIL